MKILLIHPPFLEKRLDPEDISAPPLGLYYIGAVLKQNGYAVEILNWYDVNANSDQITAALKTHDPAIIGFSVLQANRWGAIEIATLAKRISPDVKIVFGGVSATFLWEHFLTHFEAVDYVVLGEGEYAFLKLVDHIRQNESALPEQINGVAFCKGDRIIKTTPAPFIADLDQLPNPARYFQYQHVALTRGCPGECTFCGSPQFWGKQVRSHSAEYFVQQLTLLHQKGVNFFYFGDDTFTLNKKRVLQVCREITKNCPNIRWAAISRVDCIDAERLAAMRQAGCIRISYGVESGSERIRRFLNKKITRPQIETAFRLTTRHGIMARAYFIYGNPGENNDTIQATLDLIKAIRPLSAIFYILDLFPGTALYEKYIRQQGVSDDIWLKKIEDIMYFETDANLSEERILAFGERLRSAFYAQLPAFVKRIRLTDDDVLKRCHAGFLSRLGMTFDQGDYAGIEAISDKAGLALDLYRRALDYYPDPRAYLGLGVYEQKNRRYAEAVKILRQGLAHTPENPHLNLCLGVSYMNLGRFEEALAFFSRLENTVQTQPYIDECRRQMNR